MPGAAEKGQDLGRSCEAHPGGPGACFGPEVTRVLGCGQLGPVHSFYSWVLGSRTKYGTAWDWHPPLGQARAQVAHPAAPTGPDPTPHHGRARSPQHRGAPWAAGTSICPTLCPLLSVVHIGLKIPRTKIASPCRGKPGQGNTRFLISLGSAAHDPAGGSQAAHLTSSPAAHGSFGHSPIC